MKKRNEKAALGYTVPQNYFEDSKKRMMQQVMLNNKKTSRGERFLWFGAAASIAVLIGLFETNKNTPTQFDIEFESIIIESVVVEEAAFNDWFEEEYILSEY